MKARLVVLIAPAVAAPASVSSDGHMGCIHLVSSAPRNEPLLKLAYVGTCPRTAPHARRIW